MPAGPRRFGWTKDGHPDPDEAPMEALRDAALSRGDLRQWRGGGECPAPEMKPPLAPGEWWPNPPVPEIIKK